MDTIVIFTPAPGPNSSAMAQDTNAVYWYAPDSVVESGGVISAWNDKTANGYNLGQIGSIPLPSYVATGTGYVEFDGTELIGDSTFSFANGLRADIDVGGGTAAIFIVAGSLSHALGPDTSGTFTIWTEGIGAASDNQVMSNYVNVSTFFDPNRAQINTRNRRFSTAYGLASEGTVGEGSYSTMTGTALIQTVVSQVDASLNVNDGTYTANAAPSVADFASAGNGIYVGGATTDNTAITEGWPGRVYEIFATTDTSTTNVNAIRAELVAKYGIA